MALLFEAILVAVLLNVAAAWASSRFGRPQPISRPATGRQRMSELAHADERATDTP